MTIPTPPAPSDPLGDLIGDGITGALTSGIDSVMEALWAGCLWLLREAFSLIDLLSTFTVDPHSGSVGPVWSVLVWISGAVALGLFFWQLSLAMIHGGRGLGRAATGPVSYGIALAVTAGVVALSLEAADGLTTLLLSNGLRAENFSAAFTSTTLGQGVTNGIKAVALGLIGFFGLLPAALGYTLEIIWRQAAILVLVATVPITAAGMIAQSTATWFWKACRWIVAAIAVKPALALIMVIGFSVLAQTAGPAGLLASVGVLWVSLVTPLALYRLLAFVDPGTDAGGAFRERLGGMVSRLTGSFGSGWQGDHDGYAGFNNPGGGPGRPGGGGGGIGDFEAANTTRFDSASPADDDQDVPPPPPAGAVPDDSAAAPTTSSAGSPPSDVDDPQAVRPPASGSGAAGADGTAEGGAAAGAAETAVIL